MSDSVALVHATIRLLRNATDPTSFVAALRQAKSLSLPISSCTASFRRASQALVDAALACAAHRQDDPALLASLLETAACSPLDLIASLSNALRSFSRRASLLDSAPSDRVAEDSEPPETEGGRLTAAEYQTAVDFVCARLATLVLSDERFSSAIDDALSSPSIILAVPDRVSNAIGPRRRLPAVLTPSRFFARVVDCLLNTGNSQTITTGEWLSHLCCRGESHAVVEALAARPSPDIVAVLSDDALEPFLVTLLRHLQNTPDASEVTSFLLAKLMARTEPPATHARFLLVDKLATARVHTVDALLLLCDTLIALELTDETVQRLFAVWSDALFVRHTPSDRHLCATQLLVALVGRVPKKVRQVHESDWMLASVGGIQTHLACPLADRRTIGMYAAQHLSRLLSPPNIAPLSFDLSPSHDPITRVLEPRHVTQTPTHAPAPSSTPAPAPAPVSSTPGIDPGMATDSDDDEDADLIGYAIPTTEPQHPATTSSGEPSVDTARTSAAYRRFHYARDCLDAFTAMDQDGSEEAANLPARHEGALDALPRICRQSPADLADGVGSQLLRALLFLENRFDLAQFQSRRIDAMSAVACAVPAQATEYLPSTFYERNLSLYQRADVLVVIARLAQRLGAPPAPATGKPDARIQSLPQQEEKDTDEEDLPPAEVIRRRVAAKTRRFNRGTVSSAPEASANRLVPYAPRLFFTLINGVYDTPVHALDFSSNRSTVDLLQSETALLAQLIRTATTVLHSVLGQLCAIPMARAAIAFVWALVRTVAQPIVWRMVLFLISNAATAGPPELLTDDPSKRCEWSDLRAWAAESCLDCGDEQCRELAVIAIQLIDGLGV